MICDSKLPLASVPCWSHQKVLMDGQGWEQLSWTRSWHCHPRPANLLIRALVQSNAGHSPV